MLMAACVERDHVTAPTQDPGAMAVPAAAGLSAAGPVAGSLSKQGPAFRGMSRLSPDAGPASPAPLTQRVSTGPAALVAGTGGAALAGGSAAGLIWHNSVTGEGSVWHMNGASWTGGYTALPAVPVEWEIAGTADFNGDGSADLVWQNVVTGDRSIWLMQGMTWSGDFVLLPNVAPQWRIAAAADFNADGKPDLLWENVVTGDRSVWFMNGTAWSGSFALLPSVDPEWRVAAAADFTGNGKPDLLWENPVTGVRSIWLMSGTSWNGDYVLLPGVPADWRVAAASDYNDDGKVDLVWENVNHGGRSIWFMNGTAWPGGYVSLPSVNTDWRIMGVLPPAAPSGLIAIGDTVFSSLSNAGDVDVFTFTGTAGQEINLFMQPLAGAGTLRIELWDLYGTPGETRLTYFDAYPTNDLFDAYSGRLALPRTGTYTVTVSGRWGSTGGYRFQVFPIDRQPETVPATFAVGDTVTGERIYPAGDVDRFMFSGTEGQEVNLFLQPLAGAGRLRIELWDLYGTPGANRIADVAAYAGTDLHAAHSGRLALPRTGTYTVIVSGYWQGEQGEYRFQVFPINRLPEFLAPAVSVGDTVMGERVFPKGDVDEFTFTGTSGQEVNLFFQALTGAGRLQVELWDLYGTPGANRLATVNSWPSSDLHAAHSGRLVLPRSGTYTLVVSSYWSDDTGQYRFQVFPINRAPEIVAPAVAIGDTVMGERLFPKGDIDEFTFTGSAGQELNLFFQPLTGAGRLHAEVWDLYGTPGATRLAHANGWPSTNLHETHTGRFALPRSGTYTIVVSPYYGDDTGNYRFQIFPVDRQPESVASAISIGDTISGERIFPKGDVDEFVFTGAAGQDVNVFLQPYGGSGDLMVELHRVSATGVRTLLRSAHAWNTSNLEDFSTGFQTLSESGQYLLVVRGRYADSTGHYRLHVRTR
jgi:hypothetical protein